MFTLTSELAELAGLFAADGSMQKDHLCYWGNITEDKEYYDTIIKPYFEKAFSINVRPHPKKSNSVYGFYACNKKVLHYFNKTLDYPIGSKTYTVRCPKIIMHSKKPLIWAAFIRGFFDGDGCLTFDKRYDNRYRKVLQIVHHHPRIITNCASQKIIEDLSILLERLKINHFSRIKRNKKQNEVDMFTLEIYGKPRMEQWMNVIGFSNPSHFSKYEIFKRHGFVPVRTTLAQRKKIIKGIINPWQFYPKGSVAQFG